MSNLKFHRQLADHNFKFLTLGYLLVVVSLLFFSFTQVDLGLTLTHWESFQPLQRFFQHIGYFDRPLSTIFYVTIFLLLYICYFLFLFFARKKQILIKDVWLIVALVSIILVFSYNAFSYDLFNYIFDAKIITYYHQNPYAHKALDYAGDPMLSFMHWTHRVYPYGPSWLAITVPLSFAGFNYFLPTFFIFKGLMAVSFMGTVYGIGKILEKISPSKKLFGIILFGLNPFVITESLISAHNDIVMMFLAIMSIYFLLEKKYIFAILLFILSAGVKFATVFLLPVFLIIFMMQYYKRVIQWNIIFFLATISMIMPIYLASLQGEFQPWYLLWLLPFVSFLTDKKWMVAPYLIMSFSAFLYYAPFLYTGNWDPPIPTIKLWIMQGSLSLSGIILAILLLQQYLSRDKKISPV